MKSEFLIHFPVFSPLSDFGRRPKPNKAPEPTTRSVTPRASVRKMKCPVGLINLLLHESRPSGSWLIFDVGQNSMNLRTILTITLAITACQLVCAHQDRIIRLNGDKLEGLPPKYQPASFSVTDRRIALGDVSVVMPTCVWKHFGSVKAEDFRFQASWYHDPGILPYYILVRIGKAGSKVHHELLLNLDTLAVMSLKKAVVDPDGTEYDDIPIEASCAADWKVIRKK